MPAIINMEEKERDVFEKKRILCTEIPEEKKTVKKV
jgi:hypothetical protein